MVESDWDWRGDNESCALSIAGEEVEEGGHVGGDGEGFQIQPN